MWVVLGALAGIVAGVVLGERTIVLQPLGSAYAMMLQIAVYPYLLCALIYGLGRLTPAEAKRLFGAGWGVYLFMWCVTLLCHLAAGARHPADARSQRADPGCRARRGRFPQDADSGQPDRRRGAELCARGRRVRHRLRHRDPEDRAQIGAVRGPRSHPGRERHAVGLDRPLCPGRRVRPVRRRRRHDRTVAAERAFALCRACS